MLQRFSPYWLWLLLALPAFGMAYDLATSTSDRLYGMLVHQSGENAARFLIISLMATPLMMLFKGWRGPRWLVKNRRYFGVAAFAYSAVHVWAYLMKEPFSRVLAEVTEFDIWTGWLAFAIFIPLAVTSFDYAVRKMGPAWKSLQRWVYAAAVLTLLHWASLHGWRDPVGAIVQFTPLIGLTLYRLWWVYLRQRPTQVSA
jgi:methionine sulfoxide reductase heme-binding subunit